MTRLRRSLAALALFAPFSLAACAEAPPPPAASAEPPPPGVFTVGQRREVSPIDGEMLALGRAEEEIDRAFPPPAERAGPRKGAKAAPLTDGDAKSDKAQAKDQTKEEQGPLAGSGGAAGGDRCGTACKALSSMATSADHLCKLAGENDGRCDDAMARVRAATSRVKSSCPGCSVSIAAPLPGPAPVKGTPPSGPAPGMPPGSAPGMPSSATPIP